MTSHLALAAYYHEHAALTAELQRVTETAWQYEALLPRRRRWRGRGSPVLRPAPRPVVAPHAA